MSKKVNTVKMKKSEILYYRMLTVVVALFAVISSIQYAHGKMMLKPVFALVLMIGFGVLAVGAAVWAILEASKKKKTMRVFGLPFLSGLFLCLAGAFAGLWSGGVSSRRLILYATVCALLYLIYCLFDREIFSFSVYTIVGGIILSLLLSAMPLEKTVITVVIAVYAVLAVVVTLVGRSRNIKIGAQLIYGKKFKAYPYYISAGILLAGVVMSYLVVGSVIYSLAVLCAYYLIYTVVSALKNM